VKELKVVGPTDLAVLDSTSSATLTLITCFPFDYVGPAPNRFIVRAERRVTT
jgi:sortase A